MPNDKAHLEQFLAFIKENRSNEINFDTLFTRLKEECESETHNGQEPYYENLRDIMEKQAADYKISKEKSGTAWPEFEKFVSQLEKAITGALHKAN